jgi:alkanesulfonate monooxygenase SsuD/methylene tetrahydromethanopterin reductase-like flavin-dependent oxidoreductase (luciferase family)
MHLAVRLPGADDTTVLTTGRRSASPADFASFERLARTAERGLFDFLLLDGGRSSPEHEGRVHDQDVVGRPEAITVLNALAAVTERLGLAATADAIFEEPYELARRLATLDHLSGGRAAWNVVTSSDASAAENLRRGGCPDAAGRYPLAAEFVQTSRELWDSWTPDGASRPFAHRGRYFDIEGEFTVPRPPQGHPVVIHAGDSSAGRELAARAADVLLADWGSGDGFPDRRVSRHGALEAGRSLRAEMKGRLAAYGRSPGELKIMPVVAFVLGDTAAEARERAADIHRRQFSARDAISALERIRGVDLSSYDPDGPLPDIAPDLSLDLDLGLDLDRVRDPNPDREPDPSPDSDPGPSPSQDRAQGRAQDRAQDRALDRARATDVVTVAEKWWALAREKGLSVRQAAIEMSGRRPIVGTPEAIAAELDEGVRTGAADGFVLVPPATPGGLDEFVDRVVPLLQERGAFRTEYTDTTLRSHLGLAEPVWKG